MNGTANVATLRVISTGAVAIGPNTIGTRSSAPHLVERFGEGVLGVSNQSW